MFYIKIEGVLSVIYMDGAVIDRKHKAVCDRVFRDDFRA